MGYIGFTKEVEKELTRTLNQMHGLTLSVDDGKTQFSIKITEEIIKYLKD